MHRRPEFRQHSGNRYRFHRGSNSECRGDADGKSTQRHAQDQDEFGWPYVFPNINVGTYTLTVPPNFRDLQVNEATFWKSAAVSPSIAVLTVGNVENMWCEVPCRGDAGCRQKTRRSSRLSTHAKLTEMPLNGRTLEGLVSLGGRHAEPKPGRLHRKQVSCPIQRYIHQRERRAMRSAGGWMAATTSTTWAATNGPLPFPDAIGQFSVETAALGGQGR
jgi:hypothetical protein